MKERRREAVEKNNCDVGKEVLLNARLLDTARPRTRRICIAGLKLRKIKIQPTF